MNFSEIVLPSNRKFGLFFTLVFALVGFYFYYLEKVNIFLFFLSLAFVLLFLTILKPQILTPLNKLWMFLGFILGKIISPVVLGLIYFGLFSPISLFMKCIGRDELRLKLLPRESHWKKVKSEKSQGHTFRNQF